MEQLGIDPGLLLAQIVNFVIIMVVLTKLLYKPILKTLDERRKKIDEGLALAEKMNTFKQEQEEERKKMLDDARIEVRRILDDAKGRADAQKKEMLAEARVEASEIVQKGKAEVEEERVKMQKAVRGDTVDLATAMTRQLLTDIISEKDQKRLISEHTKKIERMKVN